MAADNTACCTTQKWAQEHVKDERCWPSLLFPLILVQSDTQNRKCQNHTDPWTPHLALSHGSTDAGPRASAMDPLESCVLHHEASVDLTFFQHVSLDWDLGSLEAGSTPWALCHVPLVVPEQFFACQDPQFPCRLLHFEGSFMPRD